MAKITLKGSWIKISSLNKEDKKNYLISVGFFLTGAVFWGLHLNTVDGIFGPPIFENTDTSLSFAIIRAMIIICWCIAIIYSKKFLLTQDELMHRYFLYTGAAGGFGFVTVGMLFSILQPYLSFTVGFYGYFLAYAIGTAFGGYLFDKKYLGDGE
ncbi:hypothetical protein N9F19_00990 [Gammaproteobacteria bacterium]|nr:hypothetical protein [Gammaproteobacteria bacterium]